MQDRMKTLEENHQRSMDELQNSHRLKDTTNGARRSGFPAVWPYPPPPKMKLMNLKIEIDGL